MSTLALVMALSALLAWGVTAWVRGVPSRKVGHRC